MTTLLLIRHASCDTVGRTLTGRAPGIHLNAPGAGQAELLAARLTALPLAAVYSSPLERACQTAAPVAARAGVEVVIHPGLTELDFGEWTGRAIDGLAGDPAWDRFNRERGTARIPGGESMGEAVARAAAAAEEIVHRHPGAIVAAVSHADVIRGLLAHYLGLSLDRLLRLQVSPASVSAVAAGVEPRVLAINWRAEGMGELVVEPG